MLIVGGLDIHRKQITFDYPGTATGEVRRGQIVRVPQHSDERVNRLVSCDLPSA